MTNVSPWRSVSDVYRRLEEHKKIAEDKYAKMTNPRFIKARQYWAGLVSGYSYSMILLEGYMRECSMWPPAHWPPEHLNCRSIQSPMVDQ